MPVQETLNVISVSVWLRFFSIASTSTLYSLPGSRNSAGQYHCALRPVHVIPS